MQIKNDYEAFKLALELSITAPDKEKSLRALRMAVGLIGYVTDSEVAKAFKELEIEYAAISAGR